jgi:hypothetical protein
MANNPFGYTIVTFLYKLCSEEKPLSVMTNMYSMYRRTHNASGVEQALFNQSSESGELSLLVSSNEVEERGLEGQREERG